MASEGASSLEVLAWEADHLIHHGHEVRCLRGAAQALAEGMQLAERHPRRTAPLGPWPWPHFGLQVLLHVLVVFPRAFEEQQREAPGAFEYEVEVTSRQGQVLSATESRLQLRSSGGHPVTSMDPVEKRPISISSGGFGLIHNEVLEILQDSSPSWWPTIGVGSASSDSHPPGKC